MRVGIQGQAEMPGVLGLVDGHALRAQDHRLDQADVRPVADLAQQRGEIGRLDLAGWRKLELELAQELEQVIVLRRRWRLMHAIRGRDALPEQKLRRLDVRRDHAFLDQLVGVVARLRAELDDLARGSQAELDFGAFKIDRAALLASLGQLLVELVQAVETRHQVGQFGARIGIPFANRLPDPGVGQARMRAHHRLVELRRDHLAGAIDLHVADHAQAVDLGIQRTDSVGQRLRQHRHDETGEIDRGGTQVGFLVEHAAGLHIVRDVGNGDDQTEALCVRLGIDRIVEVARILTVDRDQRQRTQVDAPLDFGGQHLRIDLGGLAGDRLGPGIGQVVAGDRHLDDDRRGQALAEYGEDAPHRSAVLGRRIADLGDHDLPRAGALVIAWPDQDVLVDAPVVRCDQGQAVLDDDAPDQA